MKMKQLFLIISITLVFVLGSVLIYLLSNRQMVIKGQFTYFCIYNENCNYNDSEAVLDELSERYYSENYYKFFELEGIDIQEVVHFSYEKDIFTTHVTHPNKVVAANIYYSIKNDTPQLAKKGLVIQYYDDEFDEASITHYLVIGLISGIFVSALLISSDFNVTFKRKQHLLKSSF